MPAQSNSLDTLFPDLAAQQMKAQQQQALAQMLMQQGAEQPAPNRMAGRYVIKTSPLENLAQLAKTAVGVWGNQNAQDQIIDARRQEMARLVANFGGGQSDSTQGSPSPASAPLVQSDQADTAGQPQDYTAPGPTQVPTAPTGGAANVSASPTGLTPPRPAPSPQDYARALTGGSGLSGFSPVQNAMFLSADPGGFYKTLAEQRGPTETIKQLAAAYGYGTPQYNQALQQLAAKTTSNIASVRPQGTLYDENTRQPIFTAPGADGRQVNWDNGQPSMSQIPGAGAVNQATSAATRAGQAQVTPRMVWDPASGTYKFTTDLAAAGGQAVDINNPTDAPPPAAAPSGPVPINLGRFGPAVAPGAAVPPAAGLQPQPAPGVAEAASGIATQGAKAYGDLRAAAADSPTRVNVLDNIVGLSKAGVATGPGQEWQNQVLGVAANFPGLSSVMSGAKDNVAKFQEMQKFLNQNALRNWQAAGGTGTDSQMEAFMHANPNDAQFPQALQAMAQWGKAGELATQAKANAADAFMTNPGNVSKFSAFENKWRANMDPRIFQLQAAGTNPDGTPTPEAQQILKGLSAADRAALAQKRMAILGMQQGQF